MTDVQIIVTVVSLVGAYAAIARGMSLIANPMQMALIDDFKNAVDAGEISEKERFGILIGLKLMNTFFGAWITFALMLVSIPGAMLAMVRGRKAHVNKNTSMKPVALISLRVMFLSLARSPLALFLSAIILMFLVGITLSGKLSMHLGTIIGEAKVVMYSRFVKSAH